MSSKLKNIKAIREMVAGTHRFQTRKSFSTDLATKQTKTREVGEVWEEYDPVTGSTVVWEQKKGYRVKKSKIADAVQEAKQYLEHYPNCFHEECKTKEKSWIDKKMRVIHGMCFDCVVEMEGRLKYQGKFNEYALNKMKNNAEAFFAEADREMEVVIESFKDIGYTNSDGSIDKFEMQDPQAYAKYIREQYQQFKQNTFKQFQQGEVGEAASDI